MHLKVVRNANCDAVPCSFLQSSTSYTEMKNTPEQTSSNIEHISRELYASQKLPILKTMLVG
jgi:hypothetical protein